MVSFEANADNSCRNIVVEDTARCQRQSETRSNVRFSGKQYRKMK